MGIKKIIWSMVLLVVLIGCEDILEEPDISESSVLLLAPTDGSSVLSNRINLNWDVVDDATSYRIQLAQPDFENTVQLLLDSIIVQDTNGTVGTAIRDIAILNGTYSWRVKARNVGFETPYTTANFTVQGDEDADVVPPNTPVLQSPEDGSTLDGTTVDFTWNRTDSNGNTERDSIFIFTDENLQNLESSGIGANKTFSIDLTANTYFWFVKAFDAAGNESEASTVFDFTVN